MNEPDPIALFRLQLIGPLVSAKLERGELQALLRELASREYEIPGSERQRVSEKTLESWYRAYLRHGFEGLVPKTRSDQGRSKIEAAVQAALLAAKRENPHRSLDTLRVLIERQGLVATGLLSRSAIHRLLKRHGLSRPRGVDGQPVERRRFEAEHAGDIWYGDVMHGPRVLVEGRKRKAYLVSLMDDASRLIVGSAFCLSEDALNIEAVLKQAVLKRGLCHKLVVDNGAAYRSGSLRKICSTLGTHLIRCRPYTPEAKGKLERYHRTLRRMFLTELNPRPLDLGELNAAWWAWLEQIYHRRPHAGLANDMTPLERFTQDLAHLRPLGPLAAKIDTIFLHRAKRLVRKDGTISYEGRYFEVPFELAGKTIWVVVDPHSGAALSVEDDGGNHLGAVTALDLQANRQRRRRKPSTQPADPSNDAFQCTGPTLVEIAMKKYYGPIQQDPDAPKTEGSDHTPSEDR
jgi:transposase InsO family protein